MNRLGTITAPSAPTPTPTWLDRAERYLTLLLIWGFLTFLCCLVAHAVYDYNERIQAQLEGAHTAGMALGATLCGRASR